jgi:oxygen tolerance protein BatD
MRKPGILLLFALLLPAGAARAADVDVHVALEPGVIGLGETATLSIEMRGEGVSSLRFRPDFQLDNLEAVSGPSQYEDLRYANGHLTRTYRLSWQVRPLGLGRAAVRDISVKLGDHQVQLQPQEIRVQREPTQQAQPRSRHDEEDEDPFQQFFGRMQLPRWRQEPEPPGVFLRAEIQPAQPVVGQQVLYTVYLFTREDIAAISPSGVPPFRGFWVQDIPIPQQPPMEMVEIDGRRYGRVPLIQKALFPLRPGHYAVDPATIDLTVERYDRNFFFGPAVSHPQTVRLRTEGQSLDVQPLPPAPPGFTGAVGQVALTARLEPRQLRLGEAATLTVELAGHGNLQGLPEPKVATPPGLTVYPPQQEGKDEIAGTLVRGRRSWSYVVVPDRTGRYRIEAPRIPYFDPAAREYRVAAAPDLELNALPRPGPPMAVASAAPHGVHSAALTARALRPPLGPRPDRRPGAAPPCFRSGWRTAAGRQPGAGGPAGNGAGGGRNGGAPAAGGGPPRRGLARLPGGALGRPQVDAFLSLERAAGWPGSGDRHPQRARTAPRRPRIPALRAAALDHGHPALRGPRPLPPPAAPAAMRCAPRFAAPQLLLSSSGRPSQTERWKGQ